MESELSQKKRGVRLNQGTVPLTRISNCSPASFEPSSLGMRFFQGLFVSLFHGQMDSRRGDPLEGAYGRQ